MSDMEIYQGLLCIGDPHLASRVPGFRKDDYPRAALRKLAWALEYARHNALLPLLLGDLFHHPRDNANWLLGEVIGLLSRQRVLGIYGNHDTRENQLNEDDSLSVILQAGALELLDSDDSQISWTGRIAGQAVRIGGTSWGRPLPKELESPAETTHTIWLTHHDVKVPGYEEQGRFSPREIPGIDLVVNGHIHRHLEDLRLGQTLWMTPGNLTRINRSDITKAHIPSVLEIRVTPSGFEPRRVEVPHEAFESVFHEAIAESELSIAPSAFVQGLAELKARRTETGAGLMEFLDKNLPQFEAPVAGEILLLAQEVLERDEKSRSTKPADH